MGRACRELARSDKTQKGRLGRPLHLPGLALQQHRHLGAELIEAGAFFG